MFELRGAANGGTISHFMHMWNVLADAAVSDVDRDRAVRRRSEWALVDVDRSDAKSMSFDADDAVQLPRGVDQVDGAWPCDVQAMTDTQLRDSFGAHWQRDDLAA